MIPTLAFEPREGHVTPNHEKRTARVHPFIDDGKAVWCALAAHERVGVQQESVCADVAEDHDVVVVQRLRCRRKRFCCGVVGDVVYTPSSSAQRSNELVAANLIPARGVGGEAFLMDPVREPGFSGEEDAAMSVVDGNLLESYSWVGRGLGEVDQGVDEDVPCTRDESYAGDRAEITGLDGLVQVQTDARPREDGLHDHYTAEQ